MFGRRQPVRQTVSSTYTRRRQTLRKVIKLVLLCLHELQFTYGNVHNYQLCTTNQVRFTLPN